MTDFTLGGIRRVRETNLSRVLALIHQSAFISRAAIVRQTGLSATTVSALMNLLLDSGIVRESRQGESSGGRPPILLRFNHSFRYLLGVDMGATHLTVVVMNLAGEVAARRHQPFDVAHDPAGTTVAIVSLAEEAMAAAGQSSATMLGTGVAVPAPLEGEHLDRPSALILPRWEGYDLVGALQASVPVPICVENDANAGALAEKWWGKGSGHQNLAYIKLGTGIGSGLIVSGRIYRGDGGSAGEIGHAPIDLDGPLCRCGKRGCLESFVGAPALVERVAELRREAGESQGSVEPERLHDIIEAARNGDELAHRVLAQAGAHVGFAVASLVNVLNPGLIVLGGELVAAGDFFLGEVCSTVRARAMPKAAQEVEVCFSGVGPDAVAIGAATLVLERAFEPENLSWILAG